MQAFDMLLNFWDMRIFGEAKSPYNTVERTIRQINSSSYPKTLEKLWRLRLLSIANALYSFWDFNQGRQFTLTCIDFK